MSLQVAARRHIDAIGRRSGRHPDIPANGTGGGGRRPALIARTHKLEFIFHIARVARRERRRRAHTPAQSRAPSAESERNMTFRRAYQARLIGQLIGRARARGRQSRGPATCEACKINKRRSRDWRALWNSTLGARVACAARAVAPPRRPPEEPSVLGVLQPAPAANWRRNFSPPRRDATDKVIFPLPCARLARAHLTSSPALARDRSRSIVVVVVGGGEIYASPLGPP